MTRFGISAAPDEDLAVRPLVGQLEVQVGDSRVARGVARDHGDCVVAAGERQLRRRSSRPARPRRPRRRPSRGCPGRSCPARRQTMRASAPPGAAWRTADGAAARQAAPAPASASSTRTRPAGWMISRTGIGIAMPADPPSESASVTSAWRSEGSSSFADEAPLVGNRDARAVDRHARRGPVLIEDVGRLHVADLPLDLDPAVQRPPLGHVVRRHRPLLAEPADDEPLPRQALDVDQVAGGRFGAPLREGHVVFVGVGRIGVPLDQDLLLGVLAEDDGHPVERRPGRGAQVGPVGGERLPGEVDGDGGMPVDPEQSPRARGARAVLVLRLELVIVDVARR